MLFPEPELPSTKRKLMPSSFPNPIFQGKPPQVISSFFRIINANPPALFNLCFLYFYALCQEKSSLSAMSTSLSFFVMSMAMQSLPGPSARCFRTEAGSCAPLSGAGCSFALLSGMSALCAPACSGAFFLCDSFCARSFP